MAATTTTRMTLDDYLALAYPFNVIADPDGGYVIEFPDLKGCLTQADTLDEVGPMAAEARELWLEAAYESGIAIPLPSHPEEYSGKFNLRVPRSLHRQLVKSAEEDGVSLNHYVVTLLAQGDAVRQVEQHLDRRLDSISRQVESIDARLPYQVASPMPT